MIIDEKEAPLLALRLQIQLQIAAIWYQIGKNECQKCLICEMIL